MERRHPGLRIGVLALGLAAAAWLGACDETKAPAPGPAPAAESKASAEQSAEPAAFRFVPTLEQHLPAGAVGVPVVELSQPRQRQVVILAAVLRAGAEHVEIERWTFTQSADGQSLQLVDGGEAMLRLRPGARNPKLADLRRELAAPRVVLTRPLGLPGDEPFAVLEQLTKAIGTLRDAKAEPRARVEAAATVMRGLDDAVVFERDAIAEVADLLVPAPPAGPPLPAGVEMLSERRARVKLLDPASTAGPPAVLELQRKSDGWAIASLDRPKAAAPTPAAAPTDAATTGGGEP